MSLKKEKIFKFDKISKKLWTPTCHAPIDWTSSPKGLCNVVHNLNASTRISKILLTKAHKAANGNAGENKTT